MKTIAKSRTVKTGKKTVQEIEISRKYLMSTNLPMGEKDEDVSTVQIIAKHIVGKRLTLENPRGGFLFMFKRSDPDTVEAMGVLMQAAAITARKLAEDA